MLDILLWDIFILSSFANNALIKVIKTTRLWSIAEEECADDTRHAWWRHSSDSLKACNFSSNETAAGYSYTTIVLENVHPKKKCPGLSIFHCWPAAFFCLLDGNKGRMGARLNRRAVTRAKRSTHCDQFLIGLERERNVHAAPVLL